jgi:hypothetical protein
MVVKLYLDTRETIARRQSLFFLVPAKLARENSTSPKARSLQLGFGTNESDTPIPMHSRQWVSACLEYVCRNHRGTLCRGWIIDANAARPASQEA